MASQGALDEDALRRRLPRWLVRMLLVALLATAGVEALWRAGALTQAEWFMGDVWWSLHGVRTRAEAPVVLATIDDETLELYDDPLVFWGPHFGRAVQRLRREGATAIGLDFLLSVSAEEWVARAGMADHPISRTLDGLLRAELYRGDVVVGASLRHLPDGSWDYDPPHRSFQAVLPDRRANIGLTYFHVDADRVMRRFLPVVLDEKTEPALSFGLALVLQHLGLSAHESSWELGGRQVDARPEVEEIIYAGPAHTHHEISFWRLLSDDALSEEDRAAIDGSIAIVGIDFASSGDRWNTPLSRVGLHGQRRSMAGHEVHANIVSTLLSGERLRHPGAPVRILLFLTTALAMSAVAFAAKTRVSVLTLVALCIAWPVVGFAAFEASFVVLPAAGAVGVLAVVFTAAYPIRYDRAARRGQFLRRVFERYVSDAVVDDILHSPHGLALGGARREMSILFTDIRNFTAISEALSPEEVVEMLNEFFGRVCKPILDAGGCVDKFIGDAVMAVFGVPAPYPDHARRAVRAALAMSDSCDEFRTWMEHRFADRDLPPWDIGIGVHSGPAVAGNIGFERRTEYTVIGDTVNTASRIEGLTKTFGSRILISQQTLEAAGEGIRTGRSTEIQVKGRQQPVRVFEVLDIDDSAPQEDK